MVGSKAVPEIVRVKENLSANVPVKLLSTESGRTNTSPPLPWRAKRLSANRAASATGRIV